MIMRMYSIEDSTAGEFGQPGPMTNDNVAIRSFGQLINEPGSMMYSKPEDFNMYYVGTFETTTGTMIGELPKKLVNGASLKEN